MTGCSVNFKHRPLLAAEAHYFSLDRKVTKDQVSREASLRTGPLPCKADKTTGCIILPYSRKACASAKRRYAPATAQGHQFSLLSPEAFLLTGGTYSTLRQREANFRQREVDISAHAEYD